MTDIAVRFHCVSKRYRLRRGWYLSSLAEDALRLARRLLARPPIPHEYFWALRDITFEVKRGDTIGLIGPNGAGKSTFLKILSRVTAPTSGSFRVQGTVGALIEVGAGFHGDLTGRENIYLNAAIMGMRRAEIDAKFDSIVSFADIGDFIDTPIKHYSSGMEVRLGFAVAAHIDPDILLIDEVLAVGDAAFQAKCLNKLAELKERAKTIILVSHNMASIVQQADRVVWLDRGHIRASGPPEEVVERYLGTVRAQRGSLHTSELASSPPVAILAVRVQDSHDRNSDILHYGRTAMIEIDYALHGFVDDPVIGVTFEDVRGYPLGGLTTRFDGLKLNSTHARATVTLHLCPVLFTRGAYTITVAVHDRRLQRYLDLRPAAATFTVEGPSVATREVSGHLIYPHRWEVANAN